MDRFVIRNFKPPISTEPSEAIQSSNSAKLLEKIDEGKRIGQAQQGKSFKNEHSSSSEGVPYTEQTKEFERLDRSNSTTAAHSSFSDERSSCLPIRAVFQKLSSVKGANRKKVRCSVCFRSIETAKIYAPKGKVPKICQELGAVSRSRTLDSRQISHAFVARISYHSPY